MNQPFSSETRIRCPNCEHRQNPLDCARQRKAKGHRWKYECQKCWYLFDVKTTAVLTYHSPPVIAKEKSNDVPRREVSQCQQTVKP